MNIVKSVNKKFVQYDAKKVDLTVHEKVEGELKDLIERNRLAMRDNFS